ncbi:10690_t:CDS:2 [Entrophospora sp. SA101]|nr:10690_t:CDS:2 [Entrophospora sp. SA101]
MEIEKQFFPQISTPQIAEILILTATSLVERDPIYDELATSLLLQKLFHEKIINARLLDFDLAKLSQILVPERDKTAVCNLGSIYLPKHIINGKLDEESFQETITTAMRMLDNVIDLNYYPTEETRNSNLKHRPVGLGMGGFQDALFQLDIAYNSPQALQFADEITEKYSYYAILSSSQLAKERGVYSSYPGSK